MMFRFTIRDWLWLALVVGLATAWFVDRGRLTRPVVQGDVTVVVDDIVKNIKPGQRVMVRRDSSGRVSATIGNDLPDSGSNPIGSGNVAQNPGKQVTLGIDSDAEMIRLLTNRIPPGTPLEVAKTFMEAEGFKCSPRINGQFGDREGIDYLYCDRSEQSGMALVSRRWQVAIILRDGRVVEVDASTGLIGL